MKTLAECQRVKIREIYGVLQQQTALFSGGFELFCKPYMAHMSLTEVVCVWSIITRKVRKYLASFCQSPSSNSTPCLYPASLWLG